MTRRAPRASTQVIYARSVVKLTAENILYLDHCPILLSKFALQGDFTDGSVSIKWFNIEIVLWEVEKRQLCKERHRWSEAF